MTVKNILVAYNGGSSSENALDLAILMGRKYDAHITGVLAHGTAFVIKRLAQVLGEEERANLANFDARRCGAIAEKFKDRTSGSPSDRVEFLDISGEPDAKLSELARYYDLLVVGQYEEIEDEDHLVPHPDRIALSCGRPVIVVPKDYKVDSLIQHAVLAWDGGRAVARALSDAMQILENKSKVTVLRVGSKPSEVDSLAVVEHLARHGVPAEVAQVKKQGSVGDTIIRFCAENNAGLLVMGAYEHNKFGEDLFGGTTNDLLKRSPCPVLMSH